MRVSSLHKYIWTFNVGITGYFNFAFTRKIEKAGILLERGVPAFMLRKNPKGGRPMEKLGAIDWDETYGGFQHKLGYCGCGKKVLATSGELEEIIDYYGYIKVKRRVLSGLAMFLLRRLV